MLLITNPVARRSAALHEAALRAFEAAGVRCDAVRTEAPGHAAALARAMIGDYRAVFTLGGDGTAMEVVGALAHSGAPVGILPGGTGNLIARSLGTPMRVELAVRLLLAGEAIDIDLGLLHTGRHFAFSAGVGIDARMLEGATASAKQRYGVAAYMASAARAVFNRQPFQVRAAVDGEIIEREAVAVMVANFGSVLSDLLVLGPGIRRDDGRLDLCIFSPGGTSHAMRLIWRLFRKRYEGDDAMLYRSGQHFEIVCDPPQLIQTDGEVLSDTPFSVNVDAGAGRLLVAR